LSGKKTSKILPDYINKTFIYPLDSRPNTSYVSSPYGIRIDPVTKKPGANHTGLDLYAYTRIGTPIFAAGDGIVIHTSSNSGYGNLTVVQHDNGLVTYYAHQSEWIVKQGDKVKAGDLIGKIGNTGKSTGPHLHFEVRTGLWEECLNPINYIAVPVND
jgi:murein DD-endopeptidase MepM/ murein hydrolase activator NlpD